MSGKSLKLNAFMNTLKTVTSVIFPLITFPYTSRVLGPHGTGWITFATSFAGYFAMFASIGIPSYGIREIANVRDNPRELNARTQELFLLHLVASLSILLIYLVVVLLRTDLQEQRLLFFIASSTIPLTMMGMEWLYQGREEYMYITVRTIVFSALSIVALFLFVHRPEHYVVCAAISIASALGSSVLNFWNARTILFGPRARPLRFHVHLAGLAKTYSISLISSLYLSLDVVFLGFLSRPESVGYYAAASRLLTITWSLISSFGATLMPRLSFHSDKGNEKEFETIVNKSIAVTVMLCLPASAGLLFLNHDLILAFAGVAFLPAVDCLNLTLSGLLFASLANIFAWQVLFPKKQDSRVLGSLAIAAVVSITSNIVLIRLYAHIGAAFSKLLSEAVVCAALYFQARKSCDLRIFPWHSTRWYVLGTAIMVAALAVVARLVDGPVLTVAFSVPVGAAVYFSILVLAKDPLVHTVLRLLREKFRLA